MTSPETSCYPEIRFGGFTGHDGTVAFYSRVQALLAGARLVIDYGCGRGVHHSDPVAFRRALRNLRGADRTVIGIDVDPEAASNPAIDEFGKLQADGTWPTASASAHLIIADFVLEHIADPHRFFAEAARTLAPDGHLCIRTSNTASYVGIVSRLIPRNLHSAVLRKAQPERRDDDVFPTHYACNVPWRMRSMMKQHGLDAVVFGHGAEPSYLSFSRWAYRLGVVYQKHAPLWMAPSLFAFARLESPK